MPPRPWPSIQEEASNSASIAVVGMFELTIWNDFVEDVAMAAGYVARHAPEGHLPSLPIVWTGVVERFDPLCVRIARAPGLPASRTHAANDGVALHAANYAPGRHPAERIALALANALGALHARDRDGVVEAFQNLPPDVEETAMPRFDLMLDAFQSRARVLGLPVKYQRAFERMVKRMERAWLNPLLPLDCLDRIAA